MSPAVHGHIARLSLAVKPPSIRCCCFEHHQLLDWGVWSIHEAALAERCRFQTVAAPYAVVTIGVRTRRTLRFIMPKHISSSCGWNMRHQRTILNQRRPRLRSHDECLMITHPVDAASSDTGVLATVLSTALLKS
jgi:hypothetical protein